MQQIVAGAHTGDPRGLLEWAEADAVELPAVAVPREDLAKPLGRRVREGREHLAQALRLVARSPREAVGPARGRVVANVLVGGAAQFLPQQEREVGLVQ